MLRLRMFFWLLAIFMLLPFPAYAYIDPGTGSMILQVLAAALLAGMVFVQGIRTRLVAFLRKVFGKSESSKPGED